MVFTETRLCPLLLKIRDYSCSVMEDKNYNGWANRATWNVSLWIGNDEETYELMSSLKMTEGAQFANFCGYIWGKTTPDGDLLSEVNWQEIADFCGGFEDD